MVDQDRYDFQMKWLPEATTIDCERVRRRLIEYRMQKKVVEALGHQSHPLTAKQLAVYEDYLNKTRAIEQAVEIIIDDEIKRIIEYRFLKGQRLKDTCVRFRSIMSTRTIDRKILEGIESVANTLKLFEA